MKKPEKDPIFNELMSKSKLEMPFPDFEDNVMIQIHKQEVYKNALMRNIKISWICFIAGTVFGFILSFLLPQFQPSLFGLNPDNAVLIFQLLFSLFVLFSLEILIRYTRKLSVGELLNINFSGYYTNKNH